MATNRRKSPGIPSSSAGTEEGRQRLKTEIQQKAQQSAQKHADSEEDVLKGQDPLSIQDSQQQESVATLDDPVESGQDPLTASKLSADEEVGQADQAQRSDLRKPTPDVGQKASPAPQVSQVPTQNPQVERQRQSGTQIAKNPHPGPHFPPQGQAFAFHWVPTPGVLIDPQSGKPDFSRQCTIWTQQAAPVAPTLAGMVQRFDFPYTNNPVFSSNDGQQQRVFTAQSPKTQSEVDNMIWVAKAKGMTSVTLASPKEQGAIQDPNLRAYAMKRLAEENMKGSDPFYNHVQQQQQQAQGPVANP